MPRSPSLFSRPASGAGREAPARSLAQELRGWSDDDLVALLRARPDLLTPFPRDLAALAARACERASVQRALDGLDTPTLQVLQVLVVLPEPVGVGEVSRRWGAAAGAYLKNLCSLALVRKVPVGRGSSDQGRAGPGETEQGETGQGPAAQAEQGSTEQGSTEQAEQGRRVSAGLVCVRSVRELLGPYPAGLGPTVAEALGRRSPGRLAEVSRFLGLEPAADPGQALRRLSGHLGRQETVEELLRGAPEGARQALDSLAWGPPVGALARADRPLRSGEGAGPLDWLLARGLLAPSDDGHVVLPREVGLALRGGVVFRRPDRTEPLLDAFRQPADRVRDTAAGAAAEMVRLVGELCERWGGSPPPVLRTGGLGVRELRRTALALQVPERTAQVVVEIARLAGLVADDGRTDPVWAPTPAYDVWRSGDTGHRWVRLVEVWLPATRCPHLIGAAATPQDPQDGRGARQAVLQPLGRGLDRVGAPGLRRAVLALQVEAGAGDGWVGALDVERVRRRLDWSQPRRSGPGRDALVEATLEQAALLGVLGMGALAEQARPLLPVGVEGSEGFEAGGGAGSASAAEGEVPARGRAAAVAAQALNDALPRPVEQVLLQADLTAVVPGPPSPELEGLLSLMARVESRGGATTYRFCERSLRRALDAGRTGDDLLALLRERSPAGVPQPLQYLIADTARRHGRIRVGVAQSYLRADDASLLTEVLSDRRTAGLGLRRLAPTVLAAQAPVGTVLSVLREIGLAPAAEGPGGEMVLREPERFRTPERSAPVPVRGLPRAPGRAALASAVQALRVADGAAVERAGRDRGPDGSEGPQALEPADPVGVLAAVRGAIEDGVPLWIGYVESSGEVGRRLVDPLRVEAGRIEAFDRRTRQVRAFSAHRVSGIARAGSLHGSRGDPPGTGGSA
ncbi:MAG: hypothetical protein QG608_2070 [Actinomycetota bacterium]|nr:hypothetical protein [Actinomycetota bacterium]